MLFFVIIIGMLASILNLFGIEPILMQAIISLIMMVFLGYSILLAITVIFMEGDIKVSEKYKMLWYQIFCYIGVTFICYCAYKIPNGSDVLYNVIIWVTTIFSVSYVSKVSKNVNTSENN